MHSRTLAYGVAALVFAVDQLTKWLVIGPLDLRAVQQIQVVPIFDLTYTENRGTAFGLFPAYSDAARWTLVGFTAAVAIGVAIWIWREKARGDQLALSLILGGAVGNILDRSRLGYVVDFADLHFRGVPSFLCMSYDDGVCRPFLVFNVADAAISIGVVILLLRAFLSKDERPKENAEHA